MNRQDIQFNLTAAEATTLRSLLDPKRGLGNVTLAVTEGYAGSGLYLWITSAPDEGAFLIAPLVVRGDE